MMINKTNIFSLLILFVFFTSCNKDDSEIGLGIQPEDDLHFGTFSDSTSITTFSVEEDSIRTDELATFSMIGSMNDPIFGRTDASIYANFALPNNIVQAGFGANGSFITVDSIVLGLAYTTSTSTQRYGYKNDALLFNVHELNSNIYRDSSYYNKREMQLKSGDITFGGSGQTELINLAQKPVLLTGDTVAPQLRIRLKSNLLDAIINDSTKMSSTSTFQSNFKGVRITTESSMIPSPDAGGLYYIDMNSAQTKMTLYYHISGNTTLKTFDFPIGTNSAYFMNVKHDYVVATPELYNQVKTNPTTSLGQTRYFLQGLGGLRAKIDFPKLSHYKDSGSVAINKAELVVNVEQDPTFTTISNWALPARLNLYAVNQQDKIISFLPDQFYNAEAVGFGGNYSSGNKQYVFNMPRTFQYLLDQGEIKSLYIFVQNRSFNPSRVVLAGEDNATSPIKLKLWYTKLYQDK